MTKAEEWYKDNISENEQELSEIAALSARMIYDGISLKIDEKEILLACYATIFETICEAVRDKEKEYSDFDLNIADRLHIGYTTTDDEDDEKMGNFMVYMTHVDNNSKDEVDESVTSTIELATAWNAANIKEQSEMIMDISSKAKKKIEEIVNVKLGYHEFIIQMFCIITKCMVDYVKLKRRELQQSEYEINVAGLFKVGCAVDPDANESIYYEPQISMKLLFKNDSIASNSDED